MIHTFKFEPKFAADGNTATLGTVPNGRILKSEMIEENGKDYWLVVVDDDPVRSPPVEIYLRRTGH